MRIFPSFVNIIFIIISKSVLRFLNPAIKFDFANGVIVNKLIIILKFMLKFLNLAIKFDFAGDIIINEIKEIAFMKKGS